MAFARMLFASRMSGSARVQAGPAANNGAREHPSLATNAATRWTAKPVPNASTAHGPSAQLQDAAGLDYRPLRDRLPVAPPRALILDHAALFALSPAPDRGSQSNLPAAAPTALPPHLPVRRRSVPAQPGPPAPPEPAPQRRNMTGPATAPAPAPAPDHRAGNFGSQAQPRAAAAPLHPAERGACLCWTICGHSPLITSEEGIFHQMKLIRKPAGQRHMPDPARGTRNPRPGMTQDAIRRAYPALLARAGSTCARCCEFCIR